MRLLFCGLMLASLLQPCQVWNPHPPVRIVNGEPLFGIGRNEPVTYIDARGRVVRAENPGEPFPPRDEAPQFDAGVVFADARPFKDGLSRVVVEGPCIGVSTGPCSDLHYIGPRPRPKNAPSLVGCKYTFADRKGSLLPGSWDEARDFSEGFAAVRAGQRWGYVDKSGRLAIPPQFFGAGDFSGGLARVRTYQDYAEAYGYIGRDGVLKIPAVFSEADDFSGGFAVVRMSRQGSFHFIDSRGLPAFGRSFTAASSFRFGVAHVYNPDGTNSYLDLAGREILRY